MDHFHIPIKGTSRKITIDTSTDTDTDAEIYFAYAHGVEILKGVVLTIDDGGVSKYSCDPSSVRGTLVSSLRHVDKNGLRSVAIKNLEIHQVDAVIEGITDLLQLYKPMALQYLKVNHNLFKAKLRKLTLRDGPLCIFEGLGQATSGRGPSASTASLTSSGRWHCEDQTSEQRPEDRESGSSGTVRRRVRRYEQKK